MNDGYQAWFINGKHHRDGDRPAIIKENCYQAWYYDGKCHRDGDNPALVNTNGDKSWYKNVVMVICLPLYVLMEINIGMM
jgi:hypothetical protein